MTIRFMWAVPMAVWGTLWIGGQWATAQDATHPVTDAPHPTPASTIGRMPEAAGSYNRGDKGEYDNSYSQGQQSQSRSMRSRNDQQSDADRQSNSDQQSSNRNDRSKNRADNRQQRDLESQIQFAEHTHNGLRIESVQRGTPLYRAGLRQDDVLISYDRQPIRSQDDFDQVADYRPGERVPVVILRNGQRQTLYVRFENDRNNQNNRGQRESNETYGQSFTSSVGYLGIRFDERSPDRVIILSVASNSPAKEAGLRRGDELIALNGQQVDSPRDVTRIVSSQQPGDRLDIEFARRVRNHTQATLDQRPNNFASTQYQRSYEQARRSGSQDDQVEQSNYDQDTSMNSAPNDYNNGYSSNDQSTNRSDRAGSRSQD